MGQAHGFCHWRLFIYIKYKIISLLQLDQSTFSAGQIVINFESKENSKLKATLTNGVLKFEFSLDPDSSDVEQVLNFNDPLDNLLFAVDNYEEKNVSVITRQSDNFVMKVLRDCKIAKKPITEINLFNCDSISNNCLKELSKQLYSPGKLLHLNLHGTHICDLSTLDLPFSIQILNMYSTDITEYDLGFILDHFLDLTELNIGFTDIEKSPILLYIPEKLTVIKDST